MSNRPKSGVREVLEAIGRSPGGMTQEKDAVALLDIHLGRVQACNDAQELAELVDVRDGARRALDTTFQVRTTSVLARSHADPLVNALAPLERLIERMQKEELAKPKVQAPLRPAPKVGAPQGEQQTVEATTIPVVESVAEPEPVLPVPQKAVRDAVKTGNLKEQLKNPEFLKQTTEWVKTANPTDKVQQKDMVAVLKALEPAQDKLRKEIFELTFRTKTKSDTTNYVVPKQKNKDGTSKPPIAQWTDNTPIDPVMMNAMADVMAEFPMEHMPKAWQLSAQDGDNLTRGSFNDATDFAELTYSLTDTAEGFKAEYGAGGGCLPGDPLEKAKAFDLLIRHECGHKAGLKLAATLTKQAGAGDWKKPGTLDAVLAEIDSVVAEFVAAVQQQGAPSADAIRNAIKANQEDISEEDFPAKVAKTLGIDPKRVPGDHLLIRVLQQATTYMCGSSPVSVGGRMYRVGGPDNTWFSFSKAAWEKRLSLYQYSTPEEWFAEFYATANNRDRGLRDTAKAHYPEAWQWMKDNGCIVVGA